jgi:catechol 2,3-dioxygenase-like lactoylglutathione lyase family enzyme
VIKGAATIFAVRDMAAALAFYRNGLGFSVSFEWGNPTYYACLCRDDVDLHLIAASATQRSPDQGAICLFVADVDALHADWAGRGVALPQTLADRDYGMRDFMLSDPDGNEISAGQAIMGAA